MPNHNHIVLDSLYAEKNFWATDTTLWVKDFHGNDEKFAYYFLHTMNLEQYDCGSANPTLNRNHIHSLPVAYPPLYILPFENHPELFPEK